MSTQTNDVKPAPGYYNAKIMNYGIKKTKAGDPAPTILFEVQSDGQANRVFWQGSLKDGQAREICLKALAVCGFRHIRCFSNFADGPASGLLDMDREVQVTVEHENAQDGSGKRYARVRWINEASGGKFKDALTSHESFVLMQGMGLEADFMRIAQENGYTVNTEPLKQNLKEDVHQASDVDIPF